MEMTIEQPDPTVAEHSRRQERNAEAPRRQPRFSVILWNDEDHTYQYVVSMLQDLFGMSIQDGFEIAKTVDTAGRAVCLTTTLEHAELKRDQIHAFGRDYLVDRCAGSMKATIEPVPGE